MKTILTITSLLTAGTLFANATDLQPYLEYKTGPDGNIATEDFWGGDLLLYDGTYYDAEVRNADGSALFLSFPNSNVYGLTFVADKGFDNSFFLN